MKDKKLASTMDDNNLASKATERAKKIHENKGFYDLNSSHFTSSKDGDFDRARDTKRARLAATTTETQQKVDSQCTVNHYCSARTADTHTLTNSFSHRPKAAGHHLTT